MFLMMFFRQTATSVCGFYTGKTAGAGAFQWQI